MKIFCRSHRNKNLSWVQKLKFWIIKSSLLNGPDSTKFRPFMQNLCLMCVFFLSRDRSQSDQPLHMNMFDFEVVVVVVVVDGTVGFMNGRQGFE